MSEVPGESSLLPVNQSGERSVAVNTLEQVAPLAAPPTGAERVIAAVAHLLLLFSLPGTLVTAIIWVTQRKHSAFVSRQARQAVMWQLMANVVIIATLGILIGIAISSVGGAITAKGPSAANAVLHLGGSLIGVYVLLILAAVYSAASAVIGALFALFGRDFHYPLVGRRTRQPH